MKLLIISANLLRVRGLQYPDLEGAKRRETGDTVDPGKSQEERAQGFDQEVQVSQANKNHQEVPLAQVCADGQEEEANSKGVQIQEVAESEA